MGKLSRKFVAQTLAILLVIGVFAPLAFADTSGKSSIEPQPGPFVLDAICETIPPATPPLAPGKPAPSTLKMIELLRKLREQNGGVSSGFRSERVVEKLGQQIAGISELPKKLPLQFQLGFHQMNASRPDLALNTFTAMEKAIAKQGGRLGASTVAELRMRKATAFLRLGEQENCLTTDHIDACLFPLSTNARHILPRGSRGALEVLQVQLAEYPNDLTARWLLNLAHMTLGEYPAKVSPRYLIPPDKFASEYVMPRFEDGSAKMGLNANDLAGGTIIDDFNNDGFHDIVISAWDWQGQLRFFQNKGDGTFIERTSEAGLVGVVESLNIQQTDYNNDGFLDIWLLRGGWLGKDGSMPNSLLRNNGDGTFADVTEEAGLLSFRPTQTSRWFDFNGDGWLDLFIGNETVDLRNPYYCELYRNNGNGTFTECAEESGLRIAEFVKGVACADYDNDGRPDLYLSVRSHRPKILLHNDGPDASGKWKFSNRAEQAGVNEPILSFATFFFDYNNDGWEDLVVFGYNLKNGVGDAAADYLGLPHGGELTKLYRNNQDGTFSNASVETRVARSLHTMGNNYGDLDNDGWLDFYCGTGDPEFRTLIPNRMFRNEGGKFFQDVTTTTGTGHLQKGHGISFADLNDDGCQDIYASQGGAYSGDLAKNALFMNPGSLNKWVKLKLEGTKSNRAAIGAKIKVTVNTPEGKRDIYRVVSSGGSFGSNPLQQEIGLGNATEIIEASIIWPGSHTRQSFKALQPNHSYNIREGQAEPAVIPRKTKSGAGQQAKLQ